MPLAFVDREPTSSEVERLRLILSTYQDGSGMLPKGSATIPGWRDFERSVAAAFNGIAPENKGVFDVLLTSHDQPQVKYGLSCKMRATLNRVYKDGRVTIELSNSAKAFWAYLHQQGINQSNYRSSATEVGALLIELVRRWHIAAATRYGGVLDLARSYYLVLSYNSKGTYQLHQFSLGLPDPSSLHWYFPTVKKGGIVVPGSRLKGDDSLGNIFEWYGESGGQLKYYPLATTALWHSQQFTLEPLDLEHFSSILLEKAETYFPDKWPVN